MIDELATLTINNGEEYKEFHKRALATLTKLELARITIPPTMFLSQYLTQLNKCPNMKSYLAAYNRDFAKHLREKGDSVAFPETIGDVFTHLIESKCPSALILSNSTIIPTANAGSTARKICDLCDESYDVDNCYKRGLSFMPPALAKKVQ